MSYQQWQESDSAPWSKVNENMESLGQGFVFAERQDGHSGLTVGYHGGPFAGNTVADGTVAGITDDATNYLVVHRSTRAVSAATTTTNWDDTATYGRMARAVFAAGVLTWHDERHSAGGIFDHAAAGVQASAVLVADAGAYFAGADVESVLQEVGAALSAVVRVPAARYTIERDSTADSDPGAGLLKFNHADPTLATAIYLDDETSDGIDLSAFLASLGAAGWLKVQSAADAGEWAIYKWSAVTDDTGYFELTVACQASKGALDDADAVLVTFDSGATGASGTTGKHAIYIAAGSMRPSTTAGCAELATVEVSGGPDIHTLDFDAVTQEYAQFAFRAPKSSDEAAGFTFVPIWSHGATDTNFGVVWSLEIVAVGDDDALATAFGTAQTSTDTGGTTDDLYVGPESATVTPGGTWAEGDVLFCRVARETGDAGDTLAVDARLHGIDLFLTTNAENDA